jgi:hypothetical protein
MRSVLAQGLSIALLFTLSAAADAVTVHRSRSTAIHLRTHQRVTARPGETAAAPAHFAVPGWTDQQTRYWLDNATAGAGLD